MKILYHSLAVLGLFAAMFAVYWFLIRPGQMRLGATDPEIRTVRPGNEQVRGAQYRATRAITIAGTPEEIWPWLVQMGYGRAGFYGYDTLENIGSPNGPHSADRIIPELQQLHVNDTMPIFPRATMKVQEPVPNQTMVWVGGPTHSSTSFAWQRRIFYPLVRALRFRIQEDGKKINLAVGWNEV
ncbi:MAG TPA: hypothetical protein VMT46_04515 [Anaerolineaceae bacterium]|nr:hypothetical protein [Anaerolineaceae bacterium]